MKIRCYFSQLVRKKHRQKTFNADGILKNADRQGSATPSVMTAFAFAAHRMSATEAGRLFFLFQHV
jgi:hypothetical protein